MKDLRNIPSTPRPEEVARLQVLYLLVRVRNRIFMSWGLLFEITPDMVVETSFRGVFTE